MTLCVMYLRFFLGKERGPKVCQNNTFVMKNKKNYNLRNRILENLIIASRDPFCFRF